MGTILAFLGSAAARALLGQLADAYKAHEQAQTDQERLAAQERITALEARKAVLVAEAWNGINSWMRVLLAAPVGILLWKVFVWDKSFGQWTQGRTDALSPELWWVVNAVIVFYFLTESLDRWGRK